MEQVTKLLDEMNTQASGEMRVRFVKVLHALLPLFSLQYIHTSLQGLVQSVLNTDVRKMKMSQREDQDIKRDDEEEDAEEEEEEKDAKQDKENRGIKERRQKSPSKVKPSRLNNMSHWLRLCFHRTEQFSYFVFFSLCVCVCVCVCVDIVYVRAVYTCMLQ